MSMEASDLSSIPRVDRGLTSGCRSSSLRFPMQIKKLGNGTIFKIAIVPTQFMCESHSTAIVFPLHYQTGETLSVCDAKSRALDRTYEMVVSLEVIPGNRSEEKDKVTIEKGGNAYSP